MVAPSRRRGVDADLAGLKIDLLVRALDDADLQIDDAVGAEGRNHRSGLGVQRDETIARRDIENALVASAIRPVRDPAARQLTR